MKSLQGAPADKLRVLEIWEDRVPHGVALGLCNVLLLPTFVVTFSRHILSFLSLLLLGSLGLFLIQFSFYPGAFMIVLLIIIIIYLLFLFLSVCENRYEFIFLLLAF